MSKDMRVAPNLLRLIPDIFFDTLAYILPASYLFIGIMTISASLGDTLIGAYLDLGASFDRFIVVLLGMGILYIVGELITHFSYDDHSHHQQPMGWFRGQRNPLPAFSP